MKKKKLTVAERLVEIRQRGVQYRAAEVVGVDLAARTVELAFSSEAPVAFVWKVNTPRENWFPTWLKFCRLYSAPKVKVCLPWVQNTLSTI